MTSSDRPVAEGASRRHAVLELADTIAGIERGHPLRVAIDGVGASGKTCLADELASALRARGRQVIRAGVDGFHNPPAARYRRGADSPLGYYEDSFDHQAIWECLAGPLGAGGDRRYRVAVYDFRSERSLETPTETAVDDAILLFDGVFLLRPELRSWWDLSVFVHTAFDVTLARALERDVELFGSREEVRRRYEVRYIPGEKLYLERARPLDLADAIFLNDEPERAALVWRTGRPGVEQTAAGQSRREGTQ